MVKVALIGCGGIAKGAHIPGYKNIDNAEVVAVCDILPERMDEAESKLGKTVKKYTDYKELIEKEDIDMADICTPNYLHADIAIYALEHGVNAFSEKPDTISVERVLDMKRAQEESGKHLMVMRNNRYWPSAKELKAMVENGDFGEIYTGRCGWIRRRGIPGKGGWFTTKEMSGGGPLIDLGVHMIDLAVYLMGNPRAVSVSGCTYNKFADSEDKGDSVHSKFGDAVEDGIFDVEDLAIGFIKFENGASLQIEFSWASNIKRETTFVELRGTKLGTKWSNGSYELYDGGKGSTFKNVFKKAGQYSKYKNIHGENLKHFVNVIENKEKPDFTIDQGVNMIKILDAIYKSAETGKEIIL